MFCFVVLMLTFFSLNHHALMICFDDDALMIDDLLVCWLQFQKSICLVFFFLVKRQHVDLIRSGVTRGASGGSHPRAQVRGGAHGYF